MAGQSQRSDGLPGGRATLRRLVAQAAAEMAAVEDTAVARSSVGVWGEPSGSLRRQLPAPVAGGWGFEGRRRRRDAPARP